MTNNKLSGTIPPSLGGLSLLESIELWGNRISGSVPSALAPLALGPGPEVVAAAPPPLAVPEASDVAASPPPSPASPSPADDAVCFPSAAVVTLAGGRAVPISALRPGDSIIAADANGAAVHDTVSHWSIARVCHRRHSNRRPWRMSASLLLL